LLCTPFVASERPQSQKKHREDGLFNALQPSYIGSAVGGILSWQLWR
jgi:hypothetical protein